MENSMNAETKEIHEKSFHLYQVMGTREQLDRVEIAIKTAVSNSEVNLAYKYLLVKEELSKLDGKIYYRFDRLSDKLEQKNEQNFTSIETRINERLSRFEDRMTSDLHRLETELSKQTDKIDKRFDQIMLAVLSILIGIIFMLLL